MYPFQKEGHLEIQRLLIIYHTLMPWVLIQHLVLEVVANVTILKAQHLMKMEILLVE